MFPLPAATTTLANTLQTSQPVLNTFLPYGYAEIGIIIASLAIVFIISVFAGIPEKLRVMFAHRGVRKYDLPEQHTDSSATSAALQQHKNYLKVRSGRGVSRYS